MEAKKMMLTLFVGGALLLQGCREPLRPEPPLLSIQRPLPAEEPPLQREEAPLQREEFLNQTLTQTLNQTVRQFGAPTPEPPAFGGRLKGMPQQAVPEKREEEKPLEYDKLVGVKEQVQLNVEGMPLSEFIVYVLGELLRVPYLVDESLMKDRTPVTLRLPRALDPEEVLRAVVDYLRDLGYEVSQRAQVLVIGKKKPPPPPPPTVPDLIAGEEPEEGHHRIALFYTPRYLSHFELELVLKEYHFIRPFNVEVRVFPPQRAILITGQASHVKRLLEIIQFLDVPYFKGKLFQVYSPLYLRAEELSAELSQVLGSMGIPVTRNIREPGILLLPLRTTNLLLMVFPDEQARSFTLEWIKRLDSPDALGEQKRLYTYRPRYSKATELAEALSKVFALAPQALPGLQPATPQAPPQVSPQAPPQAPLQTPPQAPPQPRGVGFGSDRLSIYADERRNLLVISTTPQLYRQIELLLRDLDIPPRQILIEATILELTMRDELQFGLQWFLRNRLTDGNYTLGIIPGISPGAFSFRAVTDRNTFELILQALSQKRLTNILSTPRLLVLDNQQASIQVGEDIPVVTGEIAPAQTVTGGQAGIVRSIQYRKTGTILTIRPTIYTENLLQLEITQEVSAMSDPPPGINSPSVLVRRIATNIVAGHGQTIILGGLIRNQKDRGETRVPLLGDIPLLGNLFRARTDSEVKTELVVLLTPYIVRNLDEARALTEEIRERLRLLK